jgi:hypothetical protein
VATTTEFLIRFILPAYSTVMSVRFLFFHSFVLRSPIRNAIGIITQV